MSLDKFSMETVDDLIFDAIEAVRGRYHKRPDKNSICKYLNVSTEAEKLYIENRIDVLLESNKIRNKKLQGSDSYFINYNKNLNYHEFTEISEKEHSSNKNDLQSSLENSINELNSELALLQSLVSEQFIFIKKSLQEINDLYQRNENTSTYTNALIKQIDDLKEENKMKNRIIQSLVKHNNAVFWQMKDQTVTMENTPSKNVIVSNLEEVVSAHTILAGIPNVKEDMKENASDIPKNNTPENVNDFPIEQIDAVNPNTITDDNNSISNNIADSIPDNSQQIDFVVSDNISNNNTSSNDNDALSNMTSVDIDVMLMEVRKNKHKEYISYISTKHSNAPSILSNTELEVSNKTNIPDNSTDAEEWKPGTSLIVGDSMIAGLREGKLSRNRKVKVRFFPGAKMTDFYYYLVPLLKKKPDNIILHFGTNDAPYKNKDELYKELKSIKDFIKKRHPSCKVYISAPILWSDNKNANSILKKYVDKLKVVEEKSVILHDNILSSHLNKDGLHLNSYGTIKLAENFISRIRMF